MKSYAIVYLVAGLSSRFGGKVKQFAQIGTNNETLIELSMNQALKAGFNKIIFVVGEKTEQLFKNKFGPSYKQIPVQYAKQEFNPEERDKPWGTCDALLSAKQLINEPFVVCNGDDLYGENTFKILVEWMEKNNSPATIGYPLKNCMPEEGSVNRAIYSADEKGYITKMVETLGIEKNKLKQMNLAEEDLASMNIFALFPETLALLEPKLGEFKQTNKGERKKECYLPEQLTKLIQEKKITLKLLRTNEKWIGITNPEDEEKAREEIKQKEQEE